MNCLELIETILVTPPVLCESQTLYSEIRPGQAPLHLSVPSLSSPLQHHSQLHSHALPASDSNVYPAIKTAFIRQWVGCQTDEGVRAAREKGYTLFQCRP